MREHFTMAHTRLGTYAAYTFGIFCILSAAPFVGIPFPTARASAYYSGKNAWLSDLSGKRLTPTQAGYGGACLRILLGVGLISRSFRRTTCGVLGAAVSVGTVIAVRDGRPLAPQIGMLAAIATVAVLL